MVTGEGLVMKGGDAEYRRGPQAKAAFGRVAPGSWITEEAMGEYGSGAYSNEPYSFASIEMYLAALGWFYDQVRGTERGGL